jgi:hypothetical protein
MKIQLPFYNNKDKNLLKKNLFKIQFPDSDDCLYLHII